MSTYAPPRLCSLLAFFAFSLACLPPSAFGAALEEPSDSSPCALAVVSGQSLALTADRDSSILSLIDYRRGVVVARLPLSSSPAAVAVRATDSKETFEAATSLPKEGCLILIQGKGRHLTEIRRLIVGREPSELAFGKPGSPSEGRLYTALAGEDCVAEVELSSNRVTRRFPVGNRPRRLGLSPDGRWLAVCCESPAEIHLLDAATGKTLSRQEISRNAYNLGSPRFTPDGAWCMAPAVANRGFSVDRGNIARGWVVNHRLVRVKTPWGSVLEQQHLNLDLFARPAADLTAAAYSPNGRWLAVSAGGSHEVLLLDAAGVPWPPGDPDDFAPWRLVEQPGLLRRVKLGGRPIDLAFADDRTLLVADLLGNAVYVLDPVDAQASLRIDLGGPGQPSRARRGEQAFFDARLSHHGWLSCHTCHTEGHTSGQSFDTLNDGGRDDYKLTPSLRGVSKTGPWTWLGGESDLRLLMIRSLHSTMQAPTESTFNAAESLTAYLTTLRHERPSSLGRDLAAVERGRRVFHEKAQCVACHIPPKFTSSEVVRLGSSPPLNPPSLLGVDYRRRFLHDGRAASLESVLKLYHRPSIVAGVSLTDEETADLTAYLRSL